MAWLTGIVYLKKTKNTHWVFFVLYLTFIVAAEMLGIYLRNTQQVYHSIHLFNYCVIPVEFLFNFWLFYVSFRASKAQKLPVLLTVLYLASWLCDIFYFSKQRFFFYSFSYTIGNLLLLILILRFFNQLVTSNAIITFRSNMQFWVSLGLLIFYLGSFPFYGLLNTMGYYYPHLTNAYYRIVFGLNCLMYLMFTISFIWGKPNLKSSSF